MSGKSVWIFAVVSCRRIIVNIHAGLLQIFYHTYKRTVAMKPIIISIGILYQ